MPNQLEVGRVYTVAYRGDSRYGAQEELPAFPQPSPADTPYTVRDRAQSDESHYVRVVRGSDSESAPVLLWVHGGSILTGSAGFPIYDPAVFATALGCTIISVNYRLGLASRPRSASGGISLEQDCFAVEDVIAAFEFGKTFLKDAGQSLDRVFLGGHSVGATVVFGIAERYADSVLGVIAATPILEAFRGSERSELVARHDAETASISLDASARLALQGEMVSDWTAGEHGSEVLGLWRPQFGASSYPWEDEAWQLSLPVFATWSDGEYADYGTVLKDRVARRAAKPGDRMRSIEIDERFGLNEKQLHLAAVPIFFGNQEDWHDSMMDEYVKSDDYLAEHLALTGEIREWMTAQQ